MAKGRGSLNRFKGSVSTLPDTIKTEKEEKRWVVEEEE